MNKAILITFLSMSLTFLMNAQSSGKLDVIVLDQVIVGNDTLPAIKLEPVTIKASSNKGSALSHSMKYHTRKAYPYAIRVGRIVSEIEEELDKLEGKRDKKKYLNSTEKLLKHEFKEDLKNLSRTQGKILIKLVHRETGNTVNELLKMYRSNVKAGWWEFLAKRFDLSTKSTLDAEGEDLALENYIQQLDVAYQRNGKKEKIQNEELDLSVHRKKRKRDRGSNE